MTRLLHTLLRTATPRPAPAPDSYECLCTTCGQVRVWRLRAVVCGRQLYKCQYCGAERFGYK